jgi:hypothetical protein
MKCVIIALAAGALVTGLKASYHWYKSSEVETRFERVTFAFGGQLAIWMIRLNWPGNSKDGVSSLIDKEWHKMDSVRD